MALNPVNGLRSLLWRVGFAIRESGQALERAGCRLQGIYSYEEERESAGHTPGARDAAGCRAGTCWLGAAAGTAPRPGMPAWGVGTPPIVTR